MNNFFKTILLFVAGISIVSCSHSGDDTEPLRDYALQYAEDLNDIETFMHTHYMTVVDNPGETDDLDVTYHLIDAGQTSIWDQNVYPRHERQVTVTQNDQEITYKVYYIELRQGSGPNAKSPCNVDRVLTAYKGEYLYTSTENSVSTLISKEFETNSNPQTYFSLTSVIRGWSEIFPQFKTGSYVGNPDGTLTYENFGAGIMFIPSGLAYYGAAQSGIPAYSPLVFNFKLYEIQRVDHDGDGIYSYLEDLNGDGYMYTLEEGVANPDNTNGPGTSVLIAPNKYSEEDEVPDFLDTDDDGDYYTTKSESRFIHPSDPAQIIRYYPYNGAATDDPSTPYVDETKGIPRKFTGPNNSNGLPTSNDPTDFTDPTRLRRYLDPLTRPPFSDQ